MASSARAGTAYHIFSYQPEDMLIIGPETRGLPPDVASDCHAAVRIPIWGHVRSINMANAASVLLYEALRQTGIPG